MMIATSSKQENSLINRPHLIILGAGASLAAFPNGESSGRQLPLMQNFVDVVGLESILENGGIEYKDLNFEEIYSRIYNLPEHQQVVQQIENKIWDYFEGMKIPSTPTLYDHLILSLRSKDVIATFNWDPFLMQSYIRNYHIAKPPHLLYLHGSVAVGVCIQDKVKGRIRELCYKCNQRLRASPLLYPIKKKDYTSSPFIQNEWETVKQVLKSAYLVTIFGYSAPESDVEAIQLLKDGWGPTSSRNFEQIEIIDIKPEGQLFSTWEDFIYGHRCWIVDSFYKSWVACHPRRTCEAMWRWFMELDYPEENWIPKDLSLSDLQKWYHQFIVSE